jgi:hypothetical protein
MKKHMFMIAMVLTIVGAVFAQTVAQKQQNLNADKHELVKSSGQSEAQSAVNPTTPQGAAKSCVPLTGPWTENFSTMSTAAPTTLPACWSNENTVATQKWTYSGSQANGIRSEPGVDMDPPWLPIRAVAWMITPQFQTEAGVVTAITISSSFSGSSAEIASLYVSTTDNDPASFVKLRDLTTAERATGWRDIHFDLLPAHIGVPIYVALVHDVQSRNAFWSVREVKAWDPASYVDVEVVAITAPEDGNNMGEETVTITLANNGGAALSNIELMLELDDVAIVTETFAGPLAPFSNTTYSFTAKVNLAAAGPHTIGVKAILTGGLVDAVPNNNTKTKTVTNTICSTITQLPYVQRVDNLSAMPPCWSQTSPKGTNRWQPAPSFQLPQATGEQEIWLISPAITLPAGAAYELKFDSRGSFPAGMATSQHQIYVSTQTDAVADFEFVYTLIGAEIPFADFVTVKVPLDYAGQTVYIGFKYTNPPTGGWPSSWRIDHVSVDRVDPCLVAINAPWTSDFSTIEDPGDWTIPAELPECWTNIGNWKASPANAFGDPAQIYNTAGDYTVDPITATTSWLITPKTLIPTVGEFAINIESNYLQGYDGDYSIATVWVSTTGKDVASFGSAPIYTLSGTDLMGEATISIPLSASLNGQSIYVAFKHEGDNLSTWGILEVAIDAPIVGPDCSVAINAEGWEEDFANFLPACWTRSDASWAKAPFGSGAANMGGPTNPSLLTSPTLNVNAANLTFEFYSMVEPAPTDAFTVLISANGGAFVEKADVTSLPVDYDFHRTRIDLAEYVGDDIQIQFSYASDMGGFWMIRDLTIQDIAGQVDAVLAQIISPTSGFNKSNAETVSVIIKNEGGSELAAGLAVQLVCDDCVTAVDVIEYTTVAIPAGGEITFPFNATLDMSAGGTYTVTVTVDPLETIGDLDLSNNSRTIEVSSFVLDLSCNAIDIAANGNQWLENFENPEYANFWDRPAFPETLDCWQYFGKMVPHWDGTEYGIWNWNGSDGMFLRATYDWGKKTEGYAVTPPLVVPTTGDFVLEFWSAGTHGNERPVAEVLIYTAGQSTVVKTLTEDELLPFEFNRIVIPLMADYAGKEIYVIFRYFFDPTGITGYVEPSSWSIDNVRVYDPLGTFDAAIVSIDSPNSNMNMGATNTVSVTIANNGGLPIQTFDLTLEVEGPTGFTPLNATVPYVGDAIAGFGTGTFTFAANNVDLTLGGDYTITVTVILPNATNTADATLSKTITNTVCDALVLDAGWGYVEDFRNLPTIPGEYGPVTILPLCWNLLTTDQSSWVSEWGYAGYIWTGTEATVGASVNGGNKTMSAYMVLQTMKLPTLPAKASSQTLIELAFGSVINSNPSSSPFPDNVGIWISETSNDPLADPSEFTQIYSVPASTGGPGLTPISVDLSAYSGKTVNIAFGYELVSSGPNIHKAQWAVTDISVRQVTYNYYTITYDDAPDANGNVITVKDAAGDPFVSGTVVKEGTKLTLNATANTADDFLFTTWMDGSTDNPYTYTVTGDVTITANFIQVIEGEALVIPGTVENGSIVVMNGSVQITVPTIVATGTQLTLTATADPGFEFSEWMDKAKDNPYTFTVTESVEISATFKPGIYTITVTQPTGEAADAECMIMVNYGKLDNRGEFQYWGMVDGEMDLEGGMYLQLIYNEGGNFEFIAWWDGNKTNLRHIPVTSDMNISAFFALKGTKYTLEIASPENGRISGTRIAFPIAVTLTPGTYDAGTEMILDATPNPGYKFVAWWDGNTTQLSRRAVLTGNTVINATFELITDVDYTITIATPVNGKIEARLLSDLSIIPSGTVVAAGTEISIRAIANDGYRFQQWWDFNTSNPMGGRIYKVTSDVTIDAMFNVVTHTVNIPTPTNGTVLVTYTTTTKETITVKDGDQVPSGTVLTLTATANAGFEFEKWWNESVNNPQLYLLEAPVSISATFKVHSSIQDLNANVLSVYPNPVTDVLNIQTEEVIRQIFVLDINGRVVMQVNGNNKTINLQALPTGNYVVRVHTETAIVPVRIVKQ